MSLLIDYREHGLGTHKDDKDKPLLKYDIPVVVTELEFGDAVWQGSGPGDEPVMVAVERKKLDDLINCMKDRRLSGWQLKGLNESYDYVYLFVEARFREGDGGVIEVPRWKGPGRKAEWSPFYGKADKMSVNYRQVMAYLDSLSLRSRCRSTGEPWRVVMTGSAWETAMRYATLYHGWVEKAWSDHKSHDTIYCGPPLADKIGYNGVVEKPSTLLKAAMQFPGLDRRARNVEKFFRTIQSMALAGLNPEIRRQVEGWYLEHPKAMEKAWRQIEGIGEVTARSAVRAVMEEGA